MRTVVIALATIAVLTAPAYSQSQGNTAKRSGSEQQQSAEPKEQKKSAAQSEKAYKAAQTPDTAYDPWRSIR